MNIFQLNQILLEYNNSNQLTTISGQGGDKAGGKSLDNIALGITKPYKQDTKQPTENEKRFPNLSKLIAQMKKDSINGDKIVIGAALNELILLSQTMNLRTDENGNMILPFGNNVRVSKKGNNFFIHLNNANEKQNQSQPIDLMGEQLPII